MSYSKKYFEEFPEAGVEPSQVEHAAYDFMGMADVSIPFGDDKAALTGDDEPIKEARPLRWHMKKVSIRETEITPAELEAYEKSKPTISTKSFGPVINAFDAKFDKRAAIHVRLQLPGWPTPKLVTGLFASAPVVDGTPNWEAARGRFALVTKNRVKGQIRPILNGQTVMPGFCFEQLEDELQVAPGLFTSEGMTEHILSNAPGTFALQQMKTDAIVQAGLKKLEAEAEGYSLAIESKEYGFAGNVAFYAKQLGMVKVTADQISVPA